MITRKITGFWFVNGDEHHLTQAMPWMGGLMASAIYFASVSVGQI